MNKYNCLHNARIIFWDFDGVIKDSVEVKTKAFMKLVNPSDAEFVERVKFHHETNGGMSRLDKIPLYLEWNGEEPSKDRVNELSEKFSRLVLQDVIDAPWVPGVEDYLRNNSHRQEFVLVSATPQKELEKILQSLELGHCFTNIFGTPMGKAESISITLSNQNISAQDCLMIGDANADIDAAKANNMPFLLRRHLSNDSVFADYIGPTINNFIGL